jgi:pimeloyl-ACP methyl ester carboxylesterase
MNSVQRSERTVQRNQLASPWPGRSVRQSVFAIVMALTTFSTAVAPAAVHSEARLNSAQPTVVLLHGAWADASSWKRVVDRLLDRGYPVIAPANPLRGLASDSAYLASVLAGITGPIVLVGHSYGGAVITNAGADNPNIKALVYIAAYIPDIGEDVFHLTGQFPGSGIVPPGNPGANLRAQPFPLPNGTSGVDLYLINESFREIFAGDLPSAETRVMAVTQRPIALQAFQEPSKAAAWKTVPSWALVALQDRAIGAANERFMATRAGARTVEVRASHAVILSEPGAVVDIILAAARNLD